jgi:hypothetical protein
MNEGCIYRINETEQGLPSSGPSIKRSTKRGSLSDRGTCLVRAICIAGAVFLGAGLGNFQAFGETPLGFRYSFSSETGSVSSQDPIANGIMFSPLSLNGLTKGATYQNSQGPDRPAITYTAFGPWTRVHGNPGVFHPENSYLSFTVFAPSGYELGATSGSFTIDQSNSGAARGGGVSFSTDFAKSQEFDVQVNVSTIPGHEVTESENFVPLGEFAGSISVQQTAGASVVPEPSTVFGGISAAGLILMFFVRRLRRGNSSRVLA